MSCSTRRRSRPWPTGSILASLSDLVVFIVRAGITRPADLKSAASSLAQSRTPVEGMVVFEELAMGLYYPIREDREVQGRAGESAGLARASK